MGGLFESGLAAINKAKENAARSYDDGDLSFFKISDGETKYIRLLHGIDGMVVFTHSCGLSFWEMSETEYEQTIRSGNTVKCPNSTCGQPLTEADIVYRRPGLMSVPMHNSVVSPSDGKRRSFVCLGQNPAFLDDNGVPKYNCPICEMVKNDGKKVKPASARYYALAVIREPEIQMENKGGVNVGTIVGMKDGTREVKDSDTGEVKVVPDIVLMGQGFKNFWSYFTSEFERHGSIAYWDYRITRVGADISTVYQFDKASPEPSFRDPRELLEFYPNVESFLSYQGSPEYYTKYGFMVPGYVPKAEESEQQQAAPAAQQQAAPVQQTLPTPQAAQQDTVQVQQAAPVVEQQAQAQQQQQPSVAPVGNAPDGATNFADMASALKDSAQDITQYNG